MFPNRASGFALEAINAAFALDDPDSSVDSNLVPRLVPAPRCTSQRLPHLLRLLLMYQDNQNRASASRIIFQENGSCTVKAAFWANFWIF